MGHNEAQLLCTCVDRAAFGGKLICVPYASIPALSFTSPFLFFVPPLFPRLSFLLGFLSSIIIKLVRGGTKNTGFSHDFFAAQAVEQTELRLLEAETELLRGKLPLRREALGEARRNGEETQHREGSLWIPSARKLLDKKVDLSHVYFAFWWFDMV